MNMLLINLYAFFAKDNEHLNVPTLNVTYTQQVGIMWQSTPVSDI